MTSKIIEDPSLIETVMNFYKDNTDNPVVWFVGGFALISFVFKHQWVTNLLSWIILADWNELKRINDQIALSDEGILKNFLKAKQYELTAKLLLGTYAKQEKMARLWLLYESHKDSLSSREVLKAANFIEENDEGFYIREFSLGEKWDFLITRILFFIAILVSASIFLLTFFVFIFSDSTLFNTNFHKVDSIEIFLVFLGSVVILFSAVTLSSVVAPYRCASDIRKLLEDDYSKNKVKEVADAACDE